MLPKENNKRNNSIFIKVKTAINPIRQRVTVTAWFFWNPCVNARKKHPIGIAIPLVMAIQDPQLAARLLPPFHFKNGDHACPTMGANKISANPI